MAFIVTARKWRPQRFDEVVGQEHITATLKNAIRNNRIAHAYLFTGPRGVGKTTTARILAKTLNCINQKDAEPCNECEMCRSIQSTQSMDIIEIDGASNRGIDEIRTLRDSVKYAPTKGKYKIYIIDEVHMLTKESFNAFLKTLEEPPEHSLFVFATTDIPKVPLTIISRCQRFDFRRIQLDTIKTLLSKIAENEKIKIDDKTLTIIAKKADGALRDAESFFDQIVSYCGNDIEAATVAKMLNLIDDEIYFTISDAVLEKNFKTVFEVTGTIYQNGWNFVDFMDGLIEHFRNIMTVVLSQKTDLVESADVYKARYIEYADKFSEGDILRILNFLNRTHQELRFTQNQKLKIEISLSHLIGLEKTSTISEILSGINSGGITAPTSARTDAGTKKNFPQTEAAERQAAPHSKKPFSSPDLSVKQVKSVARPTAANTDLSQSDFSFDSVVQKWSGFVEAVSSDKGLILGPFMRGVNLLGLEGNILNVTSEDSHGVNILRHEEEYLAKKTQEYFGKKMVMKFREEAAYSPRKEHSPREQNKTTQVPKKNDESDPFVSTILDELSGEEI